MVRVGKSGHGVAVGGQLLAGGFLIPWLPGSRAFGGVGAEVPSVLDAGRAARPVPIPPRRKASFTARVATGHSQPIVLSFSQPHETTTIVGQRMLQLKKQEPTCAWRYIPTWAWRRGETRRLILDAYVRSLPAW
jgi:hypothetical protein